MLGLEESMKVIMAAQKIGGVDNTETAKENIGALAQASNVKNLSIEISSTETYNECLQHEFKENECLQHEFKVIVGT